MKRCKKCIIPESYPGSHFNHNGICNFCVDEKKLSSPLGKDKLIALIKSVKKKGKYDCIVPLSGGKESITVLYHAVKTLGLKPIAVNFDSGFQAEIAKENMENACKILNVPLIIEKTNHNIQNKMLKEILKISAIVGMFFHICGNCEVLLRTVSINAAKKNNVPLILWGSSTIESTESYVDSRVGKRGFIKKLTLSKSIKILPHFVKYSIYSIYQRISHGVPLKYALNPFGGLPFPKETPKVIRFFDYVESNFPEQVSLIKHSLKWKHPENRVARFDCLIHCFGNHRGLHQNHISSDGVVYSRFVRHDLVSRQDALKIEEEIESSVNQECMQILDDLGLVDFKIPKIENAG